MEYNYIPLFFDFSDGYPTSIDTGHPIYQCGCYHPNGVVFCETSKLCKDCDTFPKKVYMDLVSGLTILVDASIV